MMWTFKKQEPIEEYKRFIELIKENHDKEQENNILYKALFDCSYKLFEYTGDLKKCNPEYFINNFKNRYGV